MPGDVIALVAPEHYVLRLRLPERNARFLKIGAKVFVGPRGLEDMTPDTLTEGEVVHAGLSPHGPGGGLWPMWPWPVLTIISWANGFWSL
ncbi:MAG: Secretion protein HlyD [Rhodospirillaceae bacterium]|nr:MAG: Secretion protein HlyD [Rhodospirillaceae bacterium]